MGSEMDLKTYLLPMTTEQRDAFAKRCGTTRGHLQNVAFYGKTCAPALATAIERESVEVRRQDMRPADYWLIWPDIPAPIPKARKPRESVTAR
jgi:DNA-binding transcriptional regulator YdaS (Cro superfamily)